MDKYGGENLWRFSSYCLYLVVKRRTNSLADSEDGEKNQKFKDRGNVVK